MATDEYRKLEVKNQKLIVVIICCIGVFILPFVSDCQISVPGFAYTPSFSAQVVDKDGKPLPGTYILYDYHGTHDEIVQRGSYYKNPSIVITDTNGQFKIPSFFQTKALLTSRAELEIYAGYSFITHSIFYVDTTKNSQKITLQDNTHDMKAWTNDLSHLEWAYSCMTMVELGQNVAIKNQKEFEAMIQSEHRLLNETKKAMSITNSK